MTERVDRVYWSERSGRGPARKPLTSAQIRTLYASFLLELEAKGNLQETFGFECVDEGLIPGTLGPAIAERLLVLLGYSDIWPIRPATADDWSDDQLFDVMEFMYDHVSEGNRDSGRYHSFSDCGWHFYHFDSESAQEEYRSRVNELLARVEGGLQMTDAGEIIRSAPDGLATLLDARFPALDQNDLDHVSAAIHKFQSRRSTHTQRRDAVRDLADVLESMRADVKSHMFTQDEGALFEIANKFWIRHNKPGERKDYDHDAWWSWLFYLYLDSIALVTHLKQRDDELLP